MNNTITLYRDGIREKFVFPVYVKFNHDKLLSLLLELKQSFLTSYEYDETKTNILKVLNREE